MRKDILKVSGEDNIKITLFLSPLEVVEKLLRII